MKRALASLIILISVTNFSQAQTWQTVATDLKSSFRGLSVVDDQVAWVSGTKGTIGRTITGGKTWRFIPVKGFETHDFRSLYAFDSLTAVIANVGSPGYVLRTTDGGKQWNVVYQNTDAAVFMDGIDFWDNKLGMIHGDPIRGRMFLLSTRDGGVTWQEVEEKLRPEVQEGEGSFAASGTVIRCMGKDKVAIATGGKISRLWVSDKKINFKPMSVPIIQGTETTGIFSFLFFGEQQGIVVGGDYKNDSGRTDHVFITHDSGKTWKAPATPTRGFMECVEQLQERVLIATGPGGTDISQDGGRNWHPFSDEKGYHVVRKARNGSLVVATGNGRISLVIF